jgi:hypothetical protein
MAGDERCQSTAAELEMHQQHGGTTSVVLVPGAAQRFPCSEHALLQLVSRARRIGPGKKAGDAVGRIHEPIFPPAGAAHATARLPIAA